MAIPDRPTVESQVWPGHAPTPPYETPMYLLGRKGLNLVDAIDDLDPQELSRGENVVSRYGGMLEVRPGQSALATAAGHINHLYRLNDPAATTFTRLAGGGTNLYRGQSGVLTLIDSNYSGDPLTFAGVNMPLTGTPFVFIGDRSRNRKVDRTNAVSVIGLIPGGIISQTLQAQSTKVICNFDAADPAGASAAANWTMTAGQDRNGTATAAPTAADVLGAGDLLVQVTTNPAGAAAGVGYDSIISIARTLNLTTFGGGVDISDDDLIHLRLNVFDPSTLEEIKIYFVCSSFTAGAIPGNSGNNTEAWFKAIRPNDFAPFHDRKVSSLTASSSLRTNELLQEFKADSSVDNPRPNLDTIGGITENRRLVTPTFPAGRNVWGEFGILGIPLRRGDFARVGLPQIGASSWSTITGIVIVIQTNTNVANVITFSDWSVDGGGNPDTSDADSAAYDYRVINYNIQTGAKGNPSPVQAEAQKLNPVRQKVLVTPNAALAPPNANLRQQLYRRGGGSATSTNWFFVGQNSSDGGVITDNTSDATAVTDETLEIDNDQPVTSVDASGNTVLNQIVPIFFAVEDYLFALGDPKQPGRLYRSKQGMPESWPATEFTDVCAASEELMNGGMIASQGFCFSRTRMYAILLNADGTWTTEPTACNEGLVGRWAMCVTPFGVAFVSPFGVRLSSGGVPDRLSDEMIGPLFRGETARGFFPIDFTVPTALQLEYHQNELWLTYADTQTTRRQLIYNFFDKAWRSYLFGEPVSTVYSESVQGTGASLLLGGHTTAQVYTHDGFSDDGPGIPWSFRTGALDYGDPRVEKLLSEIIVDCEIFTTTLTTQAFVNDEATAITSQSVVGISGLRRYSFEPFGTAPTRARNVNVEFSGTAPTSGGSGTGAGQRVSFNRYGVSRQLQPEITFNQPTPWEELPGGEGYVWGVIITCDTAATARSVLVEYTDNNGAITTAATLSITADGRKKLPFSFGSVLAQQIRLRPTGTCVPWIRYKIEWLSDPEPPRVQGWDTNWLNLGTYADKWLKGYLIEADTFNGAKTVVIDIDQALAQDTRTLTFNGRGIQHISFAKLRGRLFRLRSTDANFGKFFRWQPIFDEEPLQITRWQTEERPHEGLEGRWQKPLEAFISIRSAAIVTLRITTFGLSGATLNTSSYTIPSTADTKQKVRVPLNAAKGLLFEYLFTAAAGFWLYKEESELLVEDFNTGQAKWCPLMPANDDLDAARTMGVASVAAATPGGQ